MILYECVKHHLITCNLTNVNYVSCSVCNRVRYAYRVGTQLHAELV